MECGFIKKKVMKNTLFTIILFLLICASTQAQIGLGFSFNSTFISENWGLSVSKEKENSLWSLELSYLQNNVPDYDRKPLFFKQAWGANFIEKLGVHGSYFKKLTKLTPDVGLWLGAQVSVANTRFRKLDLILYPKKSIWEDDLYYRETRNSNKAFSIEYFGKMLLNVKLFKSLSMRGTYGFGLASLYNLDEQFVERKLKSRLWGQAAYFVISYSIEFVYQFQNKE